MRTILAFGDSLTWGADPATGGRHPHESLWPVVLERELRGEARVIAEGLGGRTTCFDDHSGPCDRNGTRILPVLLASHMPLDLVVIMLGTNDLKPWICGSASGATAGMRRLVQIVRTFPFDKPGMSDAAGPGRRAARRAAKAAPVGLRRGEASRNPRGWQQRIGRSPAEIGTEFFDAGTVCVASAEDGVHLDAGQTAALGRALVAPVRAITYLTAKSSLT